MLKRGDRREARKWSGIRPHERFRELCAVSITGELSAEEQRRLREHLATCSECRLLLKEFETVADVGVPLLSSFLPASASHEPRLAPDRAIDSTPAHPPVQREAVFANSGLAEQAKALTFAPRNGHRRAQLNWNYVWMPFAAAMVLTVALSMYLYQFGKHKGQQGDEAVRTTAGIPDKKMDALEQQISDAGHEQEVLRAQLAQRDGTIADLRRQVGKQSAALVDAKSAQANLERSLQNDEIEKHEVAQERSGFSQKLNAAQASLERTQKELNSLSEQRSQDGSRSESLEAQIGDLNGELRDRERMIGKQEDMLAHDSDIRELIGARDLYIAEVYDVARDGATQKPYGRVFYTKGKSLIFYAYDLKQEAGVKNASTFQAWGRRGPDKQQALNLGVFYEDNKANKRWVLKFDDPKTLEGIDAVFVTVEPNGGSHRPSGKPLLFTYLKVDPNHP